MARIHPIDRDTDFLFPPSVQGRLPENLLVRYVAKVVESLDSSVLDRSFAVCGSNAYVSSVCSQ
jgi:hypothetical protein